MKKASLRLAIVVAVVIALVAPVSAKTAGGYPGRPVEANPGAPGSGLELVDWYENWDSYPTDQNMHGLGGWKGWFNNPAATAYTRDVQRISLPNSIEIRGDSDLVHEYTVDDGVWTYTAWQYVPSDFSGTSYFILLNDYDDGGMSLNWSVQVEFDSATNLVVNDGPAGGTLPLIRGQWVEIRVEIDLVADWQEFYYGGALLFEDSWSNGMSGGGITSIGAVDLFANGATPVYYDDLSLVQPSMTCGQIVGYGRFDPYGRRIVKWRVWVVDQALQPLGEVAVTADLTWPTGGPVTRTRMSKIASGVASFHWGSNAAGTWTIDVTNMVKAGYTFVDGPQCYAEGYFK